MSHVTLAQGAVRIVSSMFHVVVRLDSLRLSTLHSSQSLSSSFWFSWFSSSSSMWVGSERSYPVRFREWGVRHYGRQHPSHKLWAQKSSTTTTSQRPLKSSSRNPPATASPRTCMTGKSVTTPSEERSLHHCSLGSEKIQRAEDKLITLLEKVCCQVSRCLSVMVEHGDLFLVSLDHSFQTPEKIHVARQEE